jgi:hypothetical protein
MEKLAEDLKSKDKSDTTAGAGQAQSSADQPQDIPIDKV